MMEVVLPSPTPTPGSHRQLSSGSKRSRSGESQVWTPAEASSSESGTAGTVGQRSFLGDLAFPVWAPPHVTIQCLSRRLRASLMFL